METQIQQNVVYQIDLDASSEDHITGVANNLPAFVTVHDFRKEVLPSQFKVKGLHFRVQGLGYGYTSFRHQEFSI